MLRLREEHSGRRRLCRVPPFRTLKNICGALEELVAGDLVEVLAVCSASFLENEYGLRLHLPQSTRHKCRFLLMLEKQFLKNLKGLLFSLGGGT